MDAQRAARPVDRCQRCGEVPADAGSDIQYVQVRRTSARAIAESTCQRVALACRLGDRARAGAPHLDVLDVGTGVGWHLAAALAAVDGTRSALRVHSLELDPSVLTATLSHCADGHPASSDAEAERWHAIVRASLSAALAKRDRAVASSAHDVSSFDVPFGAGSLCLAIGDARAALRSLPHDV